MKWKVITMLWAVGLLVLSGCQSHIPPNDLTLYRGAQLLAAGSPKSAIPFLAQTISSTPDGPEPLAMLSLAYALDLQPQQALQQAQKVVRPKGTPPGWEMVAIGIAEMTRHRPAEAIAKLQLVTAAVSPENPLGVAARQWLAMAQLQKGDPDAAIETLSDLVQGGTAQTGALLWTALIQERAGRRPEAGAALSQCAKEVFTASSQSGFPEDLDDQTVYDGAVAATAAGNMDMAQRLFIALQQRTTEISDSSVWIALITGAKGEWSTARNLLKAACQDGRPSSRGLANQLFSVVCAQEDRPDAMVQYMLAGQRLLGRNADGGHVIDQPKPEPVWLSDNLK